MTGVMVAGLGAESSCVGRQGQGFCCERYDENSWLVRQGRGFIARITLFQTRIKGLTSLVWLPKIGKPLISKS